MAEIMYEPSEDDLDLINSKIEELADVYPPAIVDLQYSPVFEGILFKAKVTNMPDEDQELSSLIATDIESFLEQIIINCM